MLLREKKECSLAYVRGTAMTSKIKDLFEFILNEQDKNNQSVVVEQPIDMSCKTTEKVREDCFSFGLLLLKNIDGFAGLAVRRGRYTVRQLDLPEAITVEVLRSFPLAQLRRLMPDVGVGSIRYTIAMRLRAKLRSRRRGRNTTRLFRQHLDAVCQCTCPCPKCVRPEMDKNDLDVPFQTN